MVAYEKEYLSLPNNLRDSYQFVYGELAFFIDDTLCKDFNDSLDVAAKCRFERERSLGIAKYEASSRRFIASVTVKIESRKEIWNHLAHEKTCPRQHLLLLAEVLAYCADSYRAMDEEWGSFANLIAYQNKKSKNA
jgi:hypothetical protein